MKWCRRAVLVSGGLLLLLTYLAYGVNARRIGLFVDDYLFGQLYHFRGPGLLLEAMRNARILTALPYILRYELLGIDGISQQLANMAIHAANAALFLYLLNRLWPGRLSFTLMVAALFVVYPAVSTQLWGAFIGVSFPMLLFLLSIVSTMAALPGHRVRRPWLGLSVLLGLAAPLTYELYFGLEMARPMVIWRLSEGHCSTGAGRLRWTLRHTMPYVVAWCCFLIWRLRLGPSLLGDYKAGDWVTPSLAGLVEKTGRGYLELLPNVWRFRFLELLARGEGWEAWAAGLAGAVAVLAVGLLILPRRRRDESSEPSRKGSSANGKEEQLRAAREYALICGVGLFLAGMGFAVLLPTTFGFDRYFSIQSRVHYAATLGASLATVAAIASLASLAMRRPRPLISGAVALLVGLSTARHYMNQLEAVRATEIQRSVLWQLAWRAPDLKPDTYLLLSGSPDRVGYWPVLNTHFEIAGALALLYEQDRTRDLFGSEFLTSDTVRRLGPDGLMHIDRLRAEQVPPERLLVVQYGRGCLKTPGPRRDGEPGGQTLLDALVPYSNPGNILPAPPGAAYPLREAVLGPEPRHGWCYYYEKASWATQHNDWEEVVRQYELARAEGERPDDPAEWLPLVTAYLGTGERDRAVELGDELRERFPQLREAVAVELADLMGAPVQGEWGRPAGQLGEQSGQVRARPR